jgi:hypothetical protein
MPEMPDTKQEEKKARNTADRKNGR